MRCVYCRLTAPGVSVDQAAARRKMSYSDGLRRFPHRTRLREASQLTRAACAITCASSHNTQHTGRAPRCSEKANIGRRPCGAVEDHGGLPHPSGECRSAAARPSRRRVGTDGLGHGGPTLKSKSRFLHARNLTIWNVFACRNHFRRIADRA